MVKTSLVFVLAFLFALPLFAQQVDTAWVRRYPVGTNLEHSAYAIAVDKAGNVYVTGMSGDSDGSTHPDYATIKYYPNGDTAWIRKYNGPGNYSDAAYAIAVDNSGNVYVTGLSYGTGTSSDYTTIKYNSNGDTVWVRRYNGPGNLEDCARALTVDDSGNVYVTGVSYDSLTYFDYTTIKYNSNGDTVWVRTYNGPGNSSDDAFAIALDGSGNVYVTGYSYGSGTWPDYATIKYDSSGDTVWVRRYNGSGNSDDVAYAIAVDGSGNVYVTGASNGDNGYQDYATIKYYPNGDTAWERRYSNPFWDRDNDDAYAIAVDGSGNVYVTGRSYGSGTRDDYATIKYDPAGNQLWVQRYNGPGNYDDEARAIAIDDYGNVYVTGCSYGGPGVLNDYATIKYNSNGDTVWVRRYNGPGNGYDYGNAIVVDSYGNVYVTGSSPQNYRYPYGPNYATIKYWQNYSPNSFSLLSPSDGVIIPYVVFFDWETAIDPDPWDTVRYDLYISVSSSFHPDSSVILHGLLVNQYTDTLERGSYYWKVRAYDKRSEIWSNQTWTYFSGILGDANGDKKVTVSDVIYLINFLFKSGPAPNPYQVGDVNCDGYLTVSDVVYLINYLFKGGPAPC